jgi:hypothetical protein
MYLFELFSGDDGGGLMDGLREQVMDILTPLAANGVPYVTIQQLVDKLSEEQSGVTIDRNLIYTLLDPNKVRLIKSVEGDRIYLQLPTSANSDVEKKKKEDQIKDQEQQKKTTEKQSLQQTSAENKPTKPLPSKDDGPLAGL